MQTMPAVAPEVETMSAGDGMLLPTLRMSLTTARTFTDEAAFRMRNEQRRPASREPRSDAAHRLKPMASGRGRYSTFDRSDRLTDQLPLTRLAAQEVAQRMLRALLGTEENASRKGAACEPIDTMMVRLLARHLRR